MDNSMHNSANPTAQPAALETLRVLELGSFIAGPFCGRLFADYGADVIKIEPPGKGDPMRRWGVADYQGQSLWWPSIARNKRAITLDLRQASGQEIFKKLVASADIIVENFRPGTLEGWGLGYEVLQAIHPGLIMVRISGFGQSGPYRDKAGFGSVAEAMGGLRYSMGYPDRPPPRVGISLGDSLAAMFGVIGGLAALQHRQQSGRGQMVDVALYEAVFALMESSLTEFMKVGALRERSGTILPGVAPSNLYPTQDGKWLQIGANADAVWRRLALLIGGEALADDPRYASHEARGQHQAQLDTLIARWTAEQPLEQLLEQLDSAAVPAGSIYSMADIVDDIHYRHREMLVEIQDKQLGSLHMPGIVPKLSATPGRVAWAGPALGEHNLQIYRELLGMTEEEYQQLQAQGVL